MGANSQVVGQDAVCARVARGAEEAIDLISLPRVHGEFRNLIVDETAALFVGAVASASKSTANLRDKGSCIELVQAFLAVDTSG